MRLNCRRQRPRRPASAVGQHQHAAFNKRASGEFTAVAAAKIVVDDRSRRGGHADGDDAR